MKLCASAPGKMILLGEYAVLFGAPALVMAVDRRAQVILEQGDGPGIEIHAPDVCPVAVRVCFAKSGDLTWLEGAAYAAQFTLVTGILRGLASDGTINAQATSGLQLRLDTRAFFAGDGQQARAKLGLGSSAALTVTLAGALATWQGQNALLADRPRWLAQLLQLHREFQGGTGSGIDLATSLYGGSLRFQARLDGTEPIAEVRPVCWPGELLRQAVWSGQSASTSNFLKRLYAWRAASPDVARRHLDDLCRLAVRGADFAEAGEAPELLDLFGTYARSLHVLGEAAKIDIFTREHERIGELASHYKLAYKPSGAGGGDLGLAVTCDPLALAEFRRALSSTPFAALDLKPDCTGFCIDSSV